MFLCNKPFLFDWFAFFSFLLLAVANFRNILCKSRELGAKTLAVCVVSTVQKNFPPDIGAHIALRKQLNLCSNFFLSKKHKNIYTLMHVFVSLFLWFSMWLHRLLGVKLTGACTGTIRRFLDKFKNETIILCLEPHERGIYEVLAPLYFPRDILEESSALWQLPKNIGGKFGEPQLVDRQIRIIHNPQHSVMISGTCIWHNT